tara:strand:+ start:701 stop:1306 length:606 start_codon:yes stop_codon:yes gene_type:complete
MTKLCPRGKAAAKRKFKVYPSAYANAYASKICAGKIKDPSGLKRKDFRGAKPKAMGGRVYKKNGGSIEVTPEISTTNNEYTKNLTQGITIGGSKKDFGGKISLKRSEDKFKGVGPKGKRKSVRLEGGKGNVRFFAEKGKTKSPFQGKGSDIKAGITFRKEFAGGGVAEAAERLRRQGLKRGGVAKGCGAIMSNRRKTTKVF